MKIAISLLILCAAVIAVAEIPRRGQSQPPSAESSMAASSTASGKKTTPSVLPVAPTTSIPPATNPAIDVTIPKVNQLVHFPLKIEGLITGRAWGVNEGEAGNVIVLDANGKAVSAPAVLMTTTDWLVLPTSFEATVGDQETTRHIQTATGFVRLNSRGDKDTDYIKAISIPVRFR